MRGKSGMGARGGGRRRLADRTETGIRRYHSGESVCGRAAKQPASRRGSRKRKRAGMRMLAIDAGNSRIKWGWFDGSAGPGQSWICQRGSGSSAGAGRAPPPDKIVISNVAGSAVRERIRRRPRAVSCRPRWIRSERRGNAASPAVTTIPPSSARPLAALIGAWHLFADPACGQCRTHHDGRCAVDEGVFWAVSFVPESGLDARGAGAQYPQLGLRGRFTYFRFHCGCHP